MVSYLKKAIGLLVAVGLWIFAFFDRLLNWVGKSTSPEDGQLLVETKFPQFVEWLVSTPGWVPPLIATAFCVWFIWWVSPQQTKIKEAGKSTDPGLYFTGTRVDFDGAPQQWDSWLYIKNFGDTREGCTVEIETLDLGGSTQEIRSPLMTEGNNDTHFKLTSGKETRLHLTSRESPDPRNPQPHMLKVGTRDIRIDRGQTPTLLISAHSGAGREAEVLVRLMVDQQYRLSAKLFEREWV